MAKQSGKVPSDTASPPFATRDGRPVSPPPAASGAHDFITNPRGTDDYGDPEQPQAQSIPQTLGSPEERTGGYAVPPPVVDVFDANARGVGSVGNARRPFKLKGGA